MGQFTSMFKAPVWVVRAAGAVLGFATVVGAVQAADPNLKVEARGLRIVGEGYGGDEGIRAFNYYPGVSLALLISAPDGGLIELDQDGCEVKQFVDNKGTNLLVEGKFSMPGLSGSSEVSSDGKAMFVEISGGGVPAKGAASIRAAGTVAVRSAKEKKSYKAENVPLKAGEKVDAGPVKFTIKTVGKPDWGDKPLRVTLEAKQDLGSIAGLRFLDAAGAEIESSEGGAMTMSFGDTVEASRDFDLAKEVDKVTIEITYWTDMQTVKVPFDLTVTPGLVSE